MLDEADAQEQFDAAAISAIEEEEEADDNARSLEQWLKKMKCTGVGKCISRSS